MPKVLIYIASGFLFVGVFPLPYVYYMLLRFIACGVFAWAAYITFERNEKLLPWTFLVLAIVFNPIFKIHFPKEIWAIIDFCSGLFLVLISGRIQDDSEKIT
mgnify:CR=1|tara:strand:- start:1077 stop:1382 length:306 start_codon:yes stop_codon:yes gene_type:complete